MVRKLNLILLVDDDDYTNLYNEIIIKKLDICNEIKVFQNGKEALDFLNPEDANDVSKQPELILLDINMPIMNGWEFLEQYGKKMGERKSETLIAMLTSSINKEDRENAFKSGMVKEFISKPLLEKNIEEIIDNHFSST